MRDLTALNAARRDADLAAVAGGGLVDVLVIGGGITGAGIALDAASRGLTAVLVEKHDLAFGTSRWSSTGSYINTFISCGSTSSYINTFISK